MPKFRKRPIVIEAEQWFPGIEIKGVKKSLVWAGRKGTIETLEGNLIVEPGDWIITGIKGERYPVKDDIFQETYDAVFDK